MGKLMAETWEQMEARHAKERADMVLAVYQRGLQQAALQDPSPNSMASINALVARRYDLKPDALKGKDRRKFICEARHEAWAKQMDAGHSMAKIGAFYSGRDHTTVLSGVRRHKQKIGANT